MGKITMHTGSTEIRITLIDRIVLVLLVLAGFEAAIFYADYWFFGGHRTNLILFIILSYAVFRGVVRSAVSWIFFLFVKIPLPVAVAHQEPVDILITAMPGEPFAMFATTIKEALLVEDPREMMERLFHLWWSKIHGEEAAQ